MRSRASNSASAAARSSLGRLSSRRSRSAAVASAMSPVRRSLLRGGSSSLQRGRPTPLPWMPAAPEAKVPGKAMRLWAAGCGEAPALGAARAAGAVPASPPSAVPAAMARCCPCNRGLLSSLQSLESNSATISARSELPFTAKARRGVHCTFLSCAGGWLRPGEGAEAGSTRNSRRLLRTSKRLQRTASQRASRSSWRLMKGFV
mmetsp:Transcript_111567/g.360104  ORF Transcript_111567/g.360104 Transcript_111567/m.360104 type:complete len:204 (-) Transcript_111567:180-791(-)